MEILTSEATLTSTQDVAEKEESLTPSLTEENDIMERKAFRDDLKRHRTKQLEFLERKLSGFAVFTRERMMNVRSNNLRKQHTDVRSTPRKAKNLVEESSDTDIQDKSPSYINGIMRDYQIAGLNWMISLYQNGLNGILADEMGLGKTIQSISMIGYLMSVRKLKGPFLVIAPLSTIDNWMREFAKFLPSAKVLKAHATGDAQLPLLKKLKAVRHSWNVAITSYEFLVRHRGYFTSINFHYAVIDEGHRAKNEKTLFPRALRKCSIQGAVMLTGTPIHNNLHELWALLNLLMPLFFNNAANFDSWFKVEDCLDPQHEQTRRLQNLLKPLMLRRIKSEVCPDIPSKVRITVFVPPTEEICVCSQKLLASDVRVTKSDGTDSQLRICNVFSFLRQAALHPFLIPGCEPIGATDAVTEQIVEYSSKMIVLDKLLERLKQRGSKVLIFSQFVIMLQILLDYFDYRGYQYCCMTGENSNEERQEQIDEFNRIGSEKFIFALSTRVGGLGLNLVTADTVIFYDMDYNPQMDLQAEDRAHRIGQQKTVHIFRLIVRATIEESLQAITQRKKQLDESVIQSKTLSRSLMAQATEFHQNSLFSTGIIDRSSVDEKLDTIFHEMSTANGLQDCDIIMHSIPRETTYAGPLFGARNLKRKNDEELIVSGKRKRKDPLFYHT